MENIIRLYSANETSFNHYETVLDQVLSFEVEEEENGLFSCEMVCPFDSRIEEGRILQGLTPRGLQLFRIIRVKKTLTAGQKTLSVYGRHITYDLLNNFIEDTRPVDKTLNQALQLILAGTQYPHLFTASSDVPGINSATYIRMNPITAIMGQNENSALNRWGGYLRRDNFNLNILATSPDIGYSIELGKNLIGIEEELDVTDVVTRIMPTVVIEEPTVTKLPEVYVDSPLINSYPHPIIKELRVELTDDEKLLPLADIYTIMRAKAQEQYALKADEPKVNYSVDFVQLRKTEKYKHLAILEDLDLSDTVSVFVPLLGVNVLARVIKYKYDGLGDRFISLELGNFKPRLTTQRADLVKLIEDVTKDLTDGVITAKLKQAIDTIAGFRGGNAVIVRNEIGEPVAHAFLDTADLATANNYVIINSNGIAFGENGLNNPPEVAISITGEVVAGSGLFDSIVTNLIQSDIGSSLTLTSNSAITQLVSNVNGKEATIIKQTTAPGSPATGQLWLDTSVTPNILKRWSGSAWVKATPTTASEVGAYSSSDGSALAGRVSTAESKITPSAITSTVETYVNANGSTVLASKSDVTQTADSLTARFTAMQDGRILYTDPTFLKGNNGISVYNNAGDGSVVLSRIAKPADAPTQSTHALRVVTTGSTSLPGAGGFYFGAVARANAVFITKIIAKIPVGKTINWASNAVGDGSLSEWITPIAGTGKYETYIHRLRCGASGSFSTTAFYYISPAGSVTWDIAYATVYDATEAEDRLITGITTVTKDGINVGISTSNTNTQLSYDGLRVYDGATERAYFGESGSYVPQLATDFITGNVVNTMGSMTFNVGTGQAYPNISSALEDLQTNYGYVRQLKEGAILKFNIYGQVSDLVALYGYNGGTIEFNFTSGSRLSGSFYLWFNNSRILIHGAGGANGTIKWGNTSNTLIWAYGTRFLHVYNMNFDKGAGGEVYGCRFNAGGYGLIEACDLGNVSYGIMSYEGSFVTSNNNIGTCGYNGLYLNAGTLNAKGTAPKGASANVSNNGFYHTLGTVTPTDSIYAPPAVVPTVFTATFKPTKMETYNRTSGYISTYYGATSAQGKYTGMDGWMEGRITFGTNVAQYWQGGYNISVQMRLHRKNSTHGTSSAVLPDADNFSATWSTGATRGGWSGYASVSTAEFSTSSNKTFVFYSPTLDSGYAIWDDAEVLVTVTKDV